MGSKGLSAFGGEPEGQSPSDFHALWGQSPSDFHALWGQSP